MSSDLTRRGGLAGMLGGVLWVLFPLGELPEVNLLLTPQVYLVYYGLGYLLPQLLLLVSLQRLHTLHRRSYGWLGTLGFYVSFTALVLTLVGGAFVMTMTAATATRSILAYLTVIMSFFILAWGSALLGLAITETLHDLPSYLGGMLLAIAVQAGWLFVFVTGATWDFGFWAGLTVPYGVAWLLLGYALVRARSKAAWRPSTSGRYSPQRTIRWRRTFER